MAGAGQAGLGTGAEGQDPPRAVRTLHANTCKHFPQRPELSPTPLPSPHSCGMRGPPALTPEPAPTPGPGKWDSSGKLWEALGSPALPAAASPQPQARREQPAPEQRSLWKGSEWPGDAPQPPLNPPVPAPAPSSSSTTLQKQNPAAQHPPAPGNRHSAGHKGVRGTQRGLQPLPRGQSREGEPEPGQRPPTLFRGRRQQPMTQWVVVAPRGEPTPSPKHCHRGSCSPPCPQDAPGLLRRDTGDSRGPSG